MTTSITIELPDEIYHRARQIALGSNREVEEIVADVLNHFFLQSANRDGELELAPSGIDRERQKKLRDLLDRESDLTEIQEGELKILAGMYRAGLLGQDEAIDKMIPPKSSLPRSIGMGASGIGDLASRCEELLWNEE